MKIYFHIIITKKNNEIIDIKPGSTIPKSWTNLIIASITILEPRRNRRVDTTIYLKEMENNKINMCYTTKTKHGVVKTSTIKTISLSELSDFTILHGKYNKRYKHKIENEYYINEILKIFYGFDSLVMSELLNPIIISDESDYVISEVSAAPNQTIISDISSKQEDINHQLQTVSFSMTSSFQEKEIMDQTLISNTCTICMEFERNQILIPCGHVLCLECSNKFLINCPICRQKIDIKYKVYL